MGLLKLAICVIGIYGCFLGWGYFQEVLTTTDYNLDLNQKEDHHQHHHEHEHEHEYKHEHEHDHDDHIHEHEHHHAKEPARFDYFVFMNLIQALIACICASIYANYRRIDIKISHVTGDLMLKYLAVGVTSCLASPIGYASLKYINFPTMTLAKSCKLVPVMLVQVVFYRKRFPLYKYISVLMITVGVSSFFMAKPGKDSNHATNSLLGVVYVLANLLLDGFTNATEDVIFKTHQISATHLMFFLNLSQALLMTLYLLNPFEPELSEAITFLTHHPAAFKDLVIFSLAGAVGQTIIFFTLEQYGSITLVTITVTRKLFSILLSVIAFGHNISFVQWISVMLVFTGIILEAYMKEKTQHGHGHGHGHHSHPQSNASNAQSPVLSNGTEKNKQE